MKILRGAQTSVHVRLFSAVEPSLFNGSNPATGIKQKNAPQGYVFSFNWLRGLDLNQRPSVNGADI